jgi:hypothetical protein
MRIDEDDEEEQLIARPLATSRDPLGMVCRWGGLLMALGLPAYVGLYSNL